MKRLRNCFLYILVNLCQGSVACVGCAKVLLEFRLRASLRLGPAGPASYRMIVQSKVQSDCVHIRIDTTSTTIMYNAFSTSELTCSLPKAQKYNLS